jgi:predicted DNA-binding protein
MSDRIESVSRGKLRRQRRNAYIKEQAEYLLAVEKALDIAVNALARIASGQRGKSEAVDAAVQINAIMGEWE